MGVTNSVKSKIKDYFNKTELKPFPQGTRLVVLIDDKTYELPSFKVAQYVDLNAKHAGTVCIARYNNSTKKTRVMCRISPEGAEQSFKNCTSKVPTQITQFRDNTELFKRVNENMQNGIPTCGKIGDDYIYVTGRITNYDGEMERKAALAILYIIAELANMKFVDEEVPVAITSAPETHDDEFELPEMILHTTKELDQFLNK